ncbi:hypothetical protein DFP72DRAFT_1091069 [Ephemerocybe angulata]|uniref:Uncharacterized protein n=1 Tax=Ephemerocybe angulata TaxID=980116 RepID=A0A8H6HH36_9AGAR|nr:hypothetical protein DFP72DRAFT_1091069 [Tulosesus angulatus]
MPENRGTTSKDIASDHGAFRDRKKGCKEAPRLDLHPSSSGSPASLPTGPVSTSLAARQTLSFNLEARDRAISVPSAARRHSRTTRSPKHSTRPPPGPRNGGGRSGAEQRRPDRENELRRRAELTRFSDHKSGWIIIKRRGHLPNNENEQHNSAIVHACPQSRFQIQAQTQQEIIIAGLFHVEDPGLYLSRSRSTSHSSRHAPSSQKTATRQEEPPKLGVELQPRFIQKQTSNPHTTTRVKKTNHPPSQQGKAESNSKHACATFPRAVSQPSKTFSKAATTKRTLLEHGVNQPLERKNWGNESNRGSCLCTHHHASTPADVF